MPLKINCPTCKKDFCLNDSNINTVEDTHCGTMRCPNKECQAILFSHIERGIIPIQEYIGDNVK